MINYFEAKSFDAGLIEASTRMASASTALSGSRGNSGAGVRDRVISQIGRYREETRIAAERKKAMAALIEKATDFYINHQPFEVAAGDSFSVGGINYDKETAEITVEMTLSPVGGEFTIIQQLARQAHSMGFANWPFTYRVKEHNPGGRIIWAVLTAGISEILVHYVYDMLTQNSISGIWDWFYIYNHVDVFGRSSWKDDYQQADAAYLEFDVKAEIINSDGKKLKTVNFPLQGTIIPLSVSGSSSAQRFAVNVEDLTDAITIKIISVNGNRADSGYVRIDQPAKTVYER
jgi:hypothetical protein